MCPILLALLKGPFGIVNAFLMFYIHVADNNSVLVVEYFYTVELLLLLK